MIILDFSQVVISSFFSSVKGHTNVAIDEKIITRIALNILRSLNKKFRNKYGKMVVACDSPNSWRYDIFPFYKIKRKLGRDSSEVDWKQLFGCIANIITDLKQNFPYTVIQVERAEADDIVGALCQNIFDQEILIISGDKDFQQLQKNKNVRQYDFINERYLNCASPEQFLKEHILHGDFGDDIPSVLCPDNYYIDKEAKRRRLTAKKKIEFEGIEGKFDHKYFKYYWRNKQLIDLTMTPSHITEEVLRQYNEGPEIDNKKKLMNFFIKKRIDLTEKIGDF
jgi:5'-3' exonuclease